MRCVIGVLGFALLTAALPAQSLVDAGGHKLNVQVAGTSRPGVPTVVFESGLGSPLAAWNGVNVTVADSTRTVAYERAGIGSSEPATGTPTLERIVADLHALLAKVAAPPPYVLVGHSYGGPIINTFAATYPKEVAGLVFIDPTDFTQTDADMTAIWEQLGNKYGRDSLRKVTEGMLRGAPPAIVAEMTEVQRMERGGFVDMRAAGMAPDVPTVILLAGKTQPLPPGTAFPGDYDRYMQVTQDQRVGHFSRMAQHATNGTLVLTSRSSHFIHASEPELVVWGIRRVVSAATPRGDELQRFVGDYQFTPAFAITVTRDGDKLVGQATGQQPFTFSQESATKFSIKMVGAQIEFETDAAGTVTAMILMQNGLRQRAPKTK